MVRWALEVSLKGQICSRIKKAFLIHEILGFVFQRISCSFQGKKTIWL